MARERTMETITKELRGMAKEYYTRVQASPVAGHYVITAGEEGSPQCLAWGRYFADHLGWTPQAYRDFIGKNTNRMVMPMEWPQWWDTGFVDREGA